MVRKFIALSRKNVSEQSKKAKQDYPDPSIHCEIIFDVDHYAWGEEQYLWQFCLWRIQGIFESLIMHTFIKNKSHKTLIGLKSKLKELIKQGFKLEQEDYDELIDWGMLRNLLSHTPPEQYRPGPLNKEDLLEYISFIKSVCIKLRSQKDAMLRYNSTLK